MSKKTETVRMVKGKGVANPLVSDQSKWEKAGWKAETETAKSGEINPKGA